MHAERGGQPQASKVPMTRSELGSRFTAWWHGAWFGFSVGALVGGWRAGPDGGGGTWLWLLSGFGLFIAYLPVAFTEIAQGMRRFRAVAK